METSHLEYVEINPSLKHKLNIQRIVEYCVDHVKTLPDYKSLSKSTHFVQYLCNMIETLCKQNDIVSEKGYKLTMAIQIYEKLAFADDREFLRNSIEYLHSNGKIKYIHICRRIFGFVKKYFLVKK